MSDSFKENSTKYSEFSLNFVSYKNYKKYIYYYYFSCKSKRKTTISYTQCNCTTIFVKFFV